MAKEARRIVRKYLGLLLFCLFVSFFVFNCRTVIQLLGVLVGPTFVNNFASGRLQVLIFKPFSVGFQLGYDARLS